MNRSFARKVVSAPFDDGVIGGAAKPAAGTLMRNNTSFPVKLTAKLRALFDRYKELLKSQDGEEARLAAYLKYYQFYVQEVMLRPEYGIGAPGNAARGILVYHPMGMGKTRLGGAISLRSRRPTVALLPRSLQQNFRDTVAATARAVGGPDAEAAAVARIQFVSMDAFNAADQVGRLGQPRGAAPVEGALDGKLIVVDEAHNFFRAIINGGGELTNARRLYDMIMAARDVAIVFLTGTPASKNPFELVPCFNMLAGQDLLPPLYNTFVRMFVDQEAGKIKNANFLANRLVGLVSHVSPSMPAEPVDGVAPAPDPSKPPPGFPAHRSEVVRVEMGRDQYRQYLLAREKEEAEGKGGEGRAHVETVETAPPLTLPGSERRAAKTYHVRSRTLSNFAPAREYANMEVKTMPADAFTPETAPKIAAIIERVKKSPGPALIYSQFVDVGGLRAVARYLRKEGFEEWRPGETEASPRFAVISGEVSADDRVRIQKAHNDLKNAHGEIIRALLVSKTGAEGLDLKCVRQTHKLEPYWDTAREDQVDARAVRLGSHESLPPEEREVHSYLYIAIANHEMWEGIPEQSREARTIDEMFHERAQKNYRLNNDARRVLRSVSIECSLFGGSDCRTCVPTDAALFHDDVAQDLRLPDPCEQTRQEEVKAKKLVLKRPGGAEETYFYIEDPEQFLGYQFFEHRDDLGGYAALDPSNPVISEILAALAEPAAK